MGNNLSDDNDIVMQDQCEECLQHIVKIKSLNEEIQQLKLLLNLKSRAIDLLENQIYLLEKYK